MTSSTVSQESSITFLPDDCLYSIFIFLLGKDLLSFRQSCKTISIVRIDEWYIPHLIIKNCVFRNIKLLYPLVNDYKIKIFHRQRNPKLIKTYSKKYMFITGNRLSVFIFVK